MFEMLDDETTNENQPPLKKPTPSTQPRFVKRSETKPKSAPSPQRNQSQSYARPTYENTRSLAAENDFKNTIENYLGVKLQKQPRHFVIDYAMLNGNRISGFIEAKCRKYKSTHFREYMISLGKLLRATDLYRLTGLKTLLAVRFEDCDMLYEIPVNQKFKVALGGRKDRNDWQDIETVAMIPIDNFTFMQRDELPF